MQIINREPVYGENFFASPAYCQEIVKEPERRMKVMNYNIQHLDMLIIPAEVATL